jgi:hypothetical protein
MNIQCNRILLYLPVLASEPQHSLERHEQESNIEVCRFAHQATCPRNKDSMENPEAESTAFVGEDPDAWKLRSPFRHMPGVEQGLACRGSREACDFEHQIGEQLEVSRFNDGKKQAT